MKFRVARWSGSNDRYFWPFTFAKDRERGSAALILSSTDDEERPANLRLSVFGYTFITVVPSWLVPPERIKVKSQFWDTETIKRLGRDWYWNTTKREFGVTVWGEDGESVHVNFRFGRQTYDSRTDKSWGFFLPWTQWRHVRHSLYDRNGNLWVTLPRYRKFDSPEYEEVRRLEAQCPTVKFEFLDYDGERLVATTKIEEREWAKGTGWFKWLSWLVPNKVRRDLDIEFSGETGKRKGSWKGGTIGTHIKILPNELHADAFIRYCNQHEMTYLHAHSQAHRAFES